jgi:hypothetical protein
MTTSRLVMVTTFWGQALLSSIRLQTTSKNYVAVSDSNTTVCLVNVAESLVVGVVNSTVISVSQ